MLSRGTYGIEFDDEKNTSYPKHRWVLIFLAVFALTVMLVRGCWNRSPADEDPTQATRFDAPETKVNRETASIKRHFFGKWFGTPDPTTNAPLLDIGKEAPLSTVIPKAAKRLSPPIQKLLDQANADEQSGNLSDARLTFLHLLGEKDAEELRPFLERKVGNINTTLLFSKQPAPGKITYTVVRGDTLGKIVKRFGCTQEFIMELNAIERPESLRLDAKLQILDKPTFELRISKADASALLTLNGEFFKRYALISGDVADIPPPGKHTVRNRIKRSLDRSEIWTGLPDDKPRHPQHICWISLGEITLQGTRNSPVTDPPPIRFRNPDIDELFLLLPIGVPVIIE